MKVWWAVWIGVSKKEVLQLREGFSPESCLLIVAFWGAVMSGE